MPLEGALLVIDDDAGFNRLFRAFCACEQVLSAESLDAGIAIAAKSSPAYIFLDVRFDGPWRTGIDAIAQLRAVAPAAKIIVMTSCPNAYDKSRAEAAGASAYVEKTGLARSNGVSESLRAVRATARRRSGAKPLRAARAAPKKG